MNKYNVMWFLFLLFTYVVGEYISVSYEMKMPIYESITRNHDYLEVVVIFSDVIDESENFCNYDYIKRRNYDSNADITEPGGIIKRLDFQAKCNLPEINLLHELKIVASKQREQNNIRKEIDNV
jgi:hypothetical protein